ncbi:MAG: phosphoribosylaminoimidazolesuccinocarboxamide synthase [Bacteroidota bacterium]|jgi:hypothetical protein|nr:phosphoribosylaminoimidazolesuccinocarboxamide synthase [Bacteroidota bacterium]
MSKKLQIRNSTAEFLVFTKQAGESTIDVRIEDETVWLTQKLLAVLFEVDVRTISEHLKNIFNSHELDTNSVIRNFRITAADGKNYNTQFYNLDAIISEEIAKAFAETEFEKYRIVQDQLFESDFDKLIKNELGGKNDELA